MNLKIRHRLWLGLGLVLALMVGSSALVYRQLSEMARIEVLLTESRQPLAAASMSLQEALTRSLAALRGYIILGGEPGKAEAIRAERANAWKSIDETLERARATAARSGDADATAALARVSPMLKEFAAVQGEIEEVAFSPENVESMRVLKEEAAPKAARIVDTITAMIDHESGLEATRERKALLGAMADFRGSFGVGLASIRAYLITGEEAYRQDFEKRWGVNTGAFERIEKARGLLAGPQREGFESLGVLRGEFEPLPGRMFELRAAPDWNKAHAWLGSKAAPRAAALQASLTELVKVQGELTARDTQALAAAQRTLFIVLGAATGTALVLGVLTAYLLSRAIVGPIDRLNARMLDIAQGEGDLTARVDGSRKDELGMLGASFNLFVEKVQGVVREVKRAAEEVAAASTEIASSAEEMARSMDEQSEQVRRISAAVEETGASIGEVTTRATSVAEKARESGSAAQSGRATVGRTVDDMGAIAKDVSLTSGIVAELGRRGEQIGSVIAVINDIADQTNLLALNAAIEAARAGEHGRGFAVVADEVRKLADRTTKATKEIGESISTIRVETDRAVEKISAGAARVSGGVERATEAGASLERIAGASAEVSSMVESIATAMTQQSSASEEIARGVQAISSGSSQAAAGASQAATASTQLATRAESLRQLVAKFKV
ncbi:MAG: methyl-accepting chemotaxis protein [Planctomycetes bacterium]|nr:methyl-accepting chemotaxis protein [Planctomycetota bacterium]